MPSLVDSQSGSLLVAKKVGSWTSTCDSKSVQWWHHQMETFSALLALCEGNPPVTGGFPLQRPVTRNFNVFFVRRLNNRLSKYSRHRWFETPPCLLWRHCNACPWTGLSASCISYPRDRTYFPWTGQELNMCGNVSECHGRSRTHIPQPGSKHTRPNSRHTFTDVPPKQRTSFRLMHSTNAPCMITSRVLTTHL